jgi:endonuclease YncB( thermonuclease family)
MRSGLAIIVGLLMLAMVHGQTLGRVIDGHTVEIDRKAVHLWGVRAPTRTEPFAEEASEALSRLVSEGITRVETTPGGEVVIYGHANSSLNLLLVREGWARPTMATSHPEYRAFHEARESAALGGKGIWAATRATSNSVRVSAPPPASTPSDARLREACGRDYKRVDIGMRFARVQQCSGTGPFSMTEQKPSSNGVVSTYENAAYRIYVVNGEIIGHMTTAKSKP